MIAFEPLQPPASETSEWKKDFTEEFEGRSVTFRDFPPYILPDSPEGVVWKTKYKRAADMMIENTEKQHERKLYKEQQQQRKLPDKECNHPLCWIRDHPDFK